MQITTNKSRLDLDRGTRSALALFAFVWLPACAQIFYPDDILSQGIGGKTLPSGVIVFAFISVLFVARVESCLAPHYTFVAMCCSLIKF